MSFIKEKFFKLFLFCEKYQDTIIISLVVQLIIIGVLSTLCILLNAPVSGAEIKNKAKPPTHAYANKIEREYERERKKLKKESLPYKKNKIRRRMQYLERRYDAIMPPQSCRLSRSSFYGGSQPNYRNRARQIVEEAVLQSYNRH